MKINIAPTATVANSVNILGSCEIGEQTVVHDWAILGFPNPYQDIFQNDEGRVVRIGPNCQIYPWALIYEGATVSESSQIHERCMVGSCTQIGSESRLMYGAQVHDNVIVGNECVITGFIGDNCVIGSGSSIFGSLVHRYNNPGIANWDTTDEEGPTIGNEVIVGWGAVIVGPVTIGDGASIAPNAVVSQDVVAGSRYGC